MSDESAISAEVPVSAATTSSTSGPTSPAKPVIWIPHDIIRDDSGEAAVAVPQRAYQVSGSTPLARRLGESAESVDGASADGARGARAAAEELWDRLLILDREDA